MTQVVDMLDAIGANAGAIPAGTKKVAIYLTGGGGIQWTNADVEKLQHDDPELELVLRIDQSNTTNPFHQVKYLVVDIEPGAANLQTAIAIATQRQRLGLRTCFYYFESEGQQVRAAVGGAGLNNWVDYWLAHWGIGREAAVALLGTDGIKAVQYANDVLGGRADLSVTLPDWPNAPAPPAPPKRSQALLTATELGKGASWDIKGVDNPGDVAIQQNDAVAVGYNDGHWTVNPLPHPATPKTKLAGLSVNVHPKLAAVGGTTAALAAIRGALAAFGVHVPVTPEEQATVLAALPLVVGWFKSSGVSVST